MPRLAIIPGNTFDDLADQGMAGRLAGYYNPCFFFDEVICLSPFETQACEVSGIRVIPCRDVELPEKIRSLGVDIIRAYGGRTPAQVAVFYRAAGVPVVVSVHDKRPEMLSSALRFADAVFVVSEELLSRVEALGVRRDRIFVVFNGVDAALMRPLDRDVFADLLSRFPFRRRLLHVGRKSPEKNIRAIIRALVRLGPEYGLVAVGQGDAAPYRELACALGVAHRCVFLPGVPQEDLVRFYNWADCVCHPSHSEAMSNVLLEALACGAAVVASCSAAAGLGEGPASAMKLVRDPDDDAVLAMRIRDVCEDHDVRRGLLAGARRSIEHLFQEKTRAREAACYRKVLSMAKEGLFRRSFWQEADRWTTNLGRRVWRRLGRR